MAPKLSVVGKNCLINWCHLDSTSIDVLIIYKQRQLNEQIKKKTHLHVSFGVKRKARTKLFMYLETIVAVAELKKKKKLKFRRWKSLM